MYGATTVEPTRAAQETVAVWWVFLRFPVQRAWDYRLSPAWPPSLLLDDGWPSPWSMTGTR
ncbi:MAG: hypothetical protein NVS2B16_03070 [Chloroflexota bacterium]